MSKRVVINGGGLVGCISAILFAKDPTVGSVCIVEKRPDWRRCGVEAGRSINLVLTSRGLYVLRQVDLWTPAMKISVPVHGRMIHNTDGTTAFQPYGISDGDVNYSVSRRALNDLLLDAAEKRGVEIRFGWDVAEMNLADGVATYHTPDGQQTLAAALFIGADGAGSATRGIIGAQHRRDGREVVDEVDRLGVSYGEVTFPSAADGSYAMDGNALHIWPRGNHFLMGLANQGGSFTGTLYLPDHSEKRAEVKGERPRRGENGYVPTFEDLREASAAEAYVKQCYPDVPALVPDMSAQVSTRPFAYLATLRCAAWVYGGRAAVVGDAAHAIVPFFGQGMNLGFESAWILHRSMERHGGAGGNDTAAALAEYEHLQHDSADAMADMAIENYCEMSEKVGDAAFRRKKQFENASERLAPHLIRSRYYLVTQTLVPYALIKKAGPIIDGVIEALIASCKEDVAELTVERIQESVGPLTTFFKSHGIDLSNRADDHFYSLSKASS